MSDAASPWIVSRRYDLAWFFGGAAASVAALALYFVFHVPVVILFWVWTLAFDGPHIGAAFTRTYLDREEWRSRKGVLLIALLTFAIGPLCLLLNVVTGSPEPFQLYLGVVTFYAYYHVVRQHYGFLALYTSKSRDFNPIDLRIDRWFLYIGCWAPYFYFVLTHPRSRVLLRLPAEGPGTAWERVAIGLCLALWALSLIAFLVRLVVRGRERLRQPRTAFLGITVLLSSVVYFYVARFEPAYVHSNGPDQDFLLLSVVVGMFHSLQYLGLVWFHNRNRYASEEDFGVARTLNRSPLPYLLFCLVFSGIVYLGFAASTGVFPGFHFGEGVHWGPVTLNQLGFCLWWGLAVNHYYLDQKIWRIRGDERLKKNLGLA